MRSRVIDVEQPADARMQNLEYSPAYQPPASKVYRPAHRSASQPLKARTLEAPFEGWSVLVLLAIALYCVVFAIIGAHWVNHDSLLLWSPALGLGIGLLISKVPRFPQAILHLGACLIGHWFAIWLTSVVAFGVPWMGLLAYLRSAFTGQLADVGIQGSEIIFFFYLTFLCFFLGYFGSWLIYRAHLPWLVALVYCSIMLVNLNYVKTDMSYLIVIMAGSLILLVARMQLVNQIAQWTREGLHTDHTWLRSITRRCMQIACAFTVLVLLLSWALPVQGQSQSGRDFWNRVDTTWNNIVNGRFSFNDLGNLASTNQPPANFFSDQLIVSGSVHLPPGEVLYYSSPDGQGEPYYLEGFSYNQFDGHTWTTTVKDRQSYPAHSPLPGENSSAQTQQATVSVTIVQPPDSTKNYLFAPAQPTRFSVTTEVYTDGTAGAWTQPVALGRNEQYSVTSVIPPVDAQALFNAATLSSYTGDGWQKDHNYDRLPASYLQVPKDLSPAVKQTALAWTQGTTDAYTALKLLESHLSDQTKFSYSLDNPAIPTNMDVVDWLLQRKIGYCTHFATAMAVMGRQLGVPTRIVSGFSQGHYDRQRKVWAVDGSDAHSWVQAYFREMGWINFDPTPTFSPNAVPPKETNPTPTSVPSRATPGVTPVATKPPLSNNQPTPPVSHNGAHRPTPGHTALEVNGNVFMGISIGLVLLSLVFCVTALLRYWWRNMYANSSFVSGVFWRFCRIASWAGLGPKASQTPYEYSSMLSQHFSQQATPLWRLTELFVRDRWGAPQNVPYPAEEESVEHLWPTLRNMLFNLFMRKVKRKS